MELQKGENECPIALSVYGHSCGEKHGSYGTYTHTHRYCKRDKHNE